MLMVEVSEVVSSLSRASTTCPRSLTIRRLYRLSSIYTTTIHVSYLPLLPHIFAVAPLILSFSLPLSIFFLLFLSLFRPFFLIVSLSFLSLSPSRSLAHLLTRSVSFSLLRSFRCPTRFPLSYRLPFSRLPLASFSSSVSSLAT